MVTRLLWLCAIAYVPVTVLAQDAEVFQYKSPVPAGNVFLAENFDDEESFNDRWVHSGAKKGDASMYDGKVKIEAPSDEKHLKGDQALVLKDKARHYGLSAALNKPFVFDHKPLIVQYEVQFQNGMECGGAYLKLLSKPALGSTADLQKQFNDRTPYSIMFGPDKCGTSQKLHLIFQHKNPITGEFSEKHWKNAHNADNAMRGKFADVFTDKKPHQYTLILNPDNTFEIKIDGRSEVKGHLLDDFDPPVNPPKEIDDVNDSKPEEWDEREKIPDASAQKPEDWDENEPKEISDPKAEKPIGWLDDEPQLIHDPSAKKPTDWDEDMDGVWEAPLVDNPNCEIGCGEWKAPVITNPKYKGKWRPPTIDNPAYKGKWKPRRIPNPAFFEDSNPFRLAPVVAVGFELWTITDNILFDNLIVTDDTAVSTQWTEDGFLSKRRVLDKDSESMLGNAFASFVDYSTQYPWLWAVYVLVIGVPIALLVSYCCMSKTVQDDEPARRKKTDLEELPEETEEGLDEETVTHTDDEPEDEAREEVEDKAEEDQELITDSPVEEGGGEPKVVKRRKARKV